MSTIFVDMDMTLNKMWIPFCENLKKEFNDFEILDRDEIQHYKLTLNYPSFPDSAWFNITNRIFSTPGFWENIEIWEDAAKVMSQLVEIHDVYIVTKPWVYYKNCAAEKMKWVENHLPFFNLEKMIFTGHKHLLRGDFIIDDAPQYMEIKDINVVAMDYPFNRKYNVDYRVKDWKGIANIFNIGV